MKLDFMSVGKEVSDHNDLSGEENLTGAIELSDEDLAGVVGARHHHHKHGHEKHGHEGHGHEGHGHEGHGHEKHGH